MTVPKEIEDLNMGYEYLRCKWVAEDESYDTPKRQIALAMQNEIIFAANRAALHRLAVAPLTPAPAPELRKDKGITLVARLVRQAGALLQIAETTAAIAARGERI